MTTQYCAQCGAKLEAEARFCMECGAPRSGLQRPVNQAAQTRGDFSWPVLLLAVGILLVAGGFVLYFFNRSEATLPASPAPVNVVESDIPYPEVVRISVADAREQVESGTAVIVDVRPVSDYETSHAANAISMPLSELPDRYVELPQDVAILTYCT